VARTAPKDIVITALLTGAAARRMFGREAGGRPTATDMVLEASPEREAGGQVGLVAPAVPTAPAIAVGAARAARRVPVGKAVTARIAATIPATLAPLGRSSPAERAARAGPTAAAVPAAAEEAAARPLR
jgi:hypothetical protein